MWLNSFLNDLFDDGICTLDVLIEPLCQPDIKTPFDVSDEPTKVSKEELEKHFFFQDDKISMSIEYYDPQNPDGR